MCARLTMTAAVLALATGSILWSTASLAENASSTTPPVELAEEWARFKSVRFSGKPIQVHLRTGYQRPIIMPEPIRLADPETLLPDCAIEVDIEVVAFSPAKHFKRHTIEFIGESSGTRYLLRVHSSESGYRIPISITK